LLVTTILSSIVSVGQPGLFGSVGVATAANDCAPFGVTVNT
jgi:hypothetical protein